jgi:ubiquinone/menaquinone biosynthesis C-methylase UbiE
MEYDKTEMPASYDRGRSHSPAMLRLWLKDLSAHVPKGSVSDIVDLGCGTGRFSGALADHFASDVIGIEPSEKMLEQARKKPPNGRVTYRRGSGSGRRIGGPGVHVDGLSSPRRSGARRPRMPPRAAR